MSRFALVSWMVVMTHSLFSGRSPGRPRTLIGVRNTSKGDDFSRSSMNRVLRLRRVQPVLLKCAGSQAGQRAHYVAAQTSDRTNDVAEPISGARTLAPMK